MTNDTRRALEIIAPMANELNIDVDADEKFMYCDGQAIGIVCNSTYATIQEFIGYAIATVWAKDKCFKIDGRTLGRIKRYWYTDEQLKQMREMERK